MLTLHVVSFDIPYPPTYGGVIDVYYKLKALADLGVKLILHCFEYRRSPSPLLNRICEEVHYYPRKKLLSSLPLQYPHIVYSRAEEGLLRRLLADEHPILFEGLHTTYFLGHPELASRLKWVRMHNIEWEYYYQLAQREPSYLRRQYFSMESGRLREFENILIYADGILTLAAKDTDYYREKFPQKVELLPPFHPNSEVSALAGKGHYCLYHGNLAVAENHEAALFLIREVFAYLDVPLVIAGAGPKPELIQAISEWEHISLVHHPDEAEMNELLRQAHIHVLPTFQATGIKLKLINSLFNGRFVIVNPPMIFRTGLEFCCTTVQDAKDYIRLIPAMMGMPFTEVDLAQRRAVLHDRFSNEKNARRLVKLLIEGRIS